MKFFDSAVRPLTTAQGVVFNDVVLHNPFLIFDNFDLGRLKRELDRILCPKDVRLHTKSANLRFERRSQDMFREKTRNVFKRARLLESVEW